MLSESWKAEHLSWEGDIDTDLQIQNAVHPQIIREK